MRTTGLVSLLLTMAMACDVPEPEGKRVGRLDEGIPVPEFTFLEAQDRPFGLKDLKGKVWICSFIFTRCQTACPPMAMEMSNVQDEFLKEEDFRILSVTVDPAYDKPAVMAEYLKEYDYRPGRWYFVTGQRKDIVAFAKALKINNDPEDPLNHSAYFVLVDKTGKIRDYYNQADGEAMKTLRKDIRGLLAE